MNFNNLLCKDLKINKFIYIYMHSFLLSKIEVGSHLYVNFSDSLHLHGETILVSTLQLSSEPFGYKAFNEVQDLMPWATSIEVCPAVCSQCDIDAFYTQRIGSQPKQILVGGAEAYQPVCWKHSLVNKL